MQKFIEPDLSLFCEETRDGTILIADSEVFITGTGYSDTVALRTARALTKPLYEEIASHIEQAPLSRGQVHQIFEQQEFGDMVTFVMEQRFKDSQLTIRSVLEELINIKNGNMPVIVKLDRWLSIFPWEIFPFPVDSDENSTLGDYVVFYSDLETRIKNRSMLGTEIFHPSIKMSKDTISIKAAGDTSIPYADEEKKMLQGFSKEHGKTAFIAEPVKSNEDLVPFLDFFKGDDYDVFHLFGHCKYTLIASNDFHFELSVNENYWLKLSALMSNRAYFNRNAIGFLNVCASLPTIDERVETPADYFVKTHAIPLVVATLFPVRSSEAVDFAGMFYNEIVPSIFDGSGVSIGFALWKGRTANNNSETCSSLLYRPVGNINRKVLSRKAIKERVNG